MRYFLVFICCAASFTGLRAAEKDSVRLLQLPDTVKAVSFIADIYMNTTDSKKEYAAGIRTALVSLELERENKEREVVFRFPSSAKIVATGLDVEQDDDELEWEYEWKDETTYKLLIASAADSAGNFVLHSGYIFLPGQNKWKLIGTCRTDGYTTLHSPGIITSGDRATHPAFLSNAWVQRPNGGWYYFSGDNIDTVYARPVINPMPNIDSVGQYNKEKALLEKAIKEGKTDVSNSVEGVYYRIIDAGNGKPVSVTDTVTVRYTLRIYNTTDVIDQANEKPATFPLNRLIKAWQLAVPLVKTGGKIKLVIPSGLAYSIRTRAPKIPPNSILEFDIEVLDTKPQAK